MKLARLQTKYGFKIFHAVEFKAKKGEFDGWSDRKCAALISDLTDLVRDNLALGMTVALPHDRYINEYRAPPIPNKMHLDSQYGACFRACVAYLMDFLALRQHRDTLNIVMEGGHRNVGDCIKDRRCTTANENNATRTRPESLSPFGGAEIR